MVPNPDLVFMFVTDFIGSLQLNAVWPPGVPPGLAIYFQFWVPDVGGPVGFAASNAMSGTAP